MKSIFLFLAKNLETVITTRMDHFYSLWTGISQTTLSNSQSKTQHLGTKKRGHISLEWLSIMARIDLKILIYVYKAVSGLSSTLHYWTSPLLLSPTRMLRSHDQLLLSIPCCHTKTQWWWRLLCSSKVLLIHVRFTHFQSFS